MPDRRRIAAAVAGLALSGSLLGCAAAPPPEQELAAILPRAESELLHASPAARDALDEGLRWIVEDAPATKVGPRAPGGPVPAPAAEEIGRPAAELPASVPVIPAPVDPVATAEDRRQPVSYATRDRVNLRQGPGVGQTILAVLPAGTEVTAQRMSGFWIRVSTPLGEGWVHEAWLREIGQEAAGGARR